MPATDLNSLAELIRQHLIPELREAMNVCAERHRHYLGEGVDNISFGTDCWSITHRRFRTLAEQAKIPFELDGLRIGCAFHHNGFYLHHHKIGDSDQDDVWSHFPYHAHGTAKAHQQHRCQLQLEFADEDVFPLPQTVVLAYMANPEEGLCAAYLTTVGKLNPITHQITAWDQALELWRRDAISPPEEAAAERVQPEAAPEVVVRLDRRKRASGPDQPPGADKNE